MTKGDFLLLLTLMVIFAGWPALLVGVATWIISEGSDLAYWFAGGVFVLFFGFISMAGRR